MTSAGNPRVGRLSASRRSRCLGGSAVAGTCRPPVTYLARAKPLSRCHGVRVRAAVPEELAIVVAPEYVPVTVSVPPGRWWLRRLRRHHPTH